MDDGEMCCVQDGRQRNDPVSQVRPNAAYVIS